MSPPPDHRPNYYAALPLDRRAQQRGDQAWIDRLLRDGATRILPVWRAQNLVAGIGEAPRAAWLSMTQIETWIGGSDAVFLGIAGEIAHFALELSHLEDPAPAAAMAAAGFTDLRSVGAVIPRDDGALLAYARGLIHWHSRHRFCGVCGHGTVSEQAGHQRRCGNPDCGAVHFPRTDPAVIMLIHDGDRIILGRQSQWPPGMNSVLAGFVEPGESLEEAVAREVLEEVGIAVADVRYQSSQPWPFPSSIMLGFTARALNRDIRLSPDEIESARWYSREELRRSPESETFRLPRRDSIARRLVDDWMAAG
ncbi:MAG TPA: NAD(+) diphosphatase [Dongiaceae bacterium]